MQVNVLDTPDPLMQDFREMVDSVLDKPIAPQMKIMAVNHYQRPSNP